MAVRVSPAVQHRVDNVATPIANKVTPGWVKAVYATLAGIIALTVIGLMAGPQGSSKSTDTPERPPWVAEEQYSQTNAAPVAWYSDSNYLKDLLSTPSEVDGTYTDPEGNVKVKPENIDPDGKVTAEDGSKVNPDFYSRTDYNANGITDQTEPEWRNGAGEEWFKEQARERARQWCRDNPWDTKNCT